jgi:hypothetical protein
MKCYQCGGTRYADVTCHIGEWGEMKRPLPLSMNKGSLFSARGRGLFLMQVFHTSEPVSCTFVRTEILGFRILIPEA